MKKGLLIILVLGLQFNLVSQPLDFKNTYKSAKEMFEKGNYSGSKVRFVIAQRKADKEQNYNGKKECEDYIYKADDCAHDILFGDRYFNKGEFDKAKIYYDKIEEQNPKDPRNTDRTLKCRKEMDYLANKKQADAFYNTQDWRQAWLLYTDCLDSSKKDLTSYKRFEKDIQRNNQECIRQMAFVNPDSMKLKLNRFTKKVKGKLKKKEKKDSNEKKKEQEKAKGPHGFLWDNLNFKRNKIHTV